MLVLRGWQPRERWQRREVELFDLAADPDETKNLAASEPEIERMHQAVAETCPVLNTLRLPTAVTRQP